MAFSTILCPSPPAGRLGNLQPVPVVSDVGQLLAQSRLSRYPGALPAQPHPEVSTSGAVRA